MSKTLPSLAIAFITLIHAMPASASETSASGCRGGSVAIGYFNGVRTTREQALEALEQMQHRYGRRRDSGEALNYELFYNTTQGVEDFVEVFEQRMTEQDGVLAGR